MGTDEADAYSSRKAHGWDRVLAFVVGGLAACHLAACAYLLLQALTTETLLEPNEGLMLEHVVRLAEARRLYTSPSLEWVPILYPPLFTYAARFVSYFIGLRLECLRVITVVAAVGIAWLTARLVRSEGGTKPMIAASVAFVPATYLLGDAFYTAGRVDMLFTLFLVATFSSLRRELEGARFPFSGLWAACAVLTKQTALPTVCVLFATALAMQPRRTWRGAATFAGGLALGIGWIHVHESEGTWWWAYLYELPSLHPRSTEETWSGFIRGDRIGATFIALLGLIVAAFSLAKTKAARPVRTLLAAFVIVTLAAGFMGDTKAGGDRNHYLPFYAALGLAFGVAGAHVARGSLGNPWSHAWHVVAAMQLATLGYDPRVIAKIRESYAPSPALLEALKSVDASTAVISHFSYLTLGRSQRLAHLQAIADIVFLLPREHPTRVDLTKALAGYAQRGPRKLIMSRWAGSLLPSEVQVRYRCKALGSATPTSPIGHSIGEHGVCVRNDP